jgi:uncharacterized membrane protein YccF (DUF307 family)
MDRLGTLDAGGTMLRAILNVIWLVFCGLWMAIAYVVAGLLCFVLIITIPFGIAAFRIAGYALWPFGRTIERRSDAGVASMIGNVLWIVLFGWWLAIGHLVTGVLLALTIIGIPLAAADFKMIPITLLPLGVRIVPVDRPYAEAVLGWPAPVRLSRARRRGPGERAFPTGLRAVAARPASDVDGGESSAAGDPA